MVKPAEKAYEKEKKKKKEILKLCVSGAVEPYCGSQADYSTIRVHGTFSV